MLGVHVQEFDEETLNCLPRIDSPKRLPSPYQISKRFFDLFCALFALIALFPLMAGIFVAIRFTSAGAPVYKQKRIGRRGNIFTIYKFRTMFEGADDLQKSLNPEELAVYQINRKLENDPRVTKVGRFLRKTSLDELPQLLNILKGDMSIVGPRPMLPEEIHLYGSEYMRYITIRPGLTGLWQIKSRHRTVMEERARIDAQYIENRGMLYDLAIILKTVTIVLNSKGAQ